MTFKNGDTYEGEYMNGEHHGRGKYKCAGSCEFYDGQYSDGERHGQGTLKTLLLLLKTLQIMT